MISISDKELICIGVRQMALLTVHNMHSIQWTQCAVNMLYTWSVLIGLYTQTLYAAELGDICWS